MNGNKIFDREVLLWRSFQDEETLSPTQLQQFKNYVLLLQKWNKKINLTSLTSVSDIIMYHFKDSLVIRKFIDFNGINGIADIGSGAGFPGIPLKILYPQVFIVLIEINQKKIAFLETVIRELSLSHIEICPLDWRTFLRKTSYETDLFMSRASLHVEELLRIFKPACIYNNARLVYWASQHWILPKKEEPYFEKEEQYMIASKKRRLIFFRRKNAQT